MSNEQTEALKPCPFCGTELRKMSEGLGYRHPIVGTCPLSDWHMEADGYSETRWNTRAATLSPAPSDTLERREAMRVAMVDAARARGGAGAEFIANGHTNLWLDIAYDAAATLSLPAREVSGERARYRHKKRGTIYELFGEAELQAEQPQVEKAALTIYRGEDGKLWARNSAEFHDGRFEQVALATTPAPREKLEADLAVLEEIHGAMARAIDAMASAEPWRIRDARNLLERGYDRLRIVMNRLSGEG